MMKVSDSKSSQIFVKIISGKPNKKLPVGFSVEVCDGVGEEICILSKALR